jgi:hypothetical protein
MTIGDSPGSLADAGKPVYQAARRGLRASSGRGLDMEISARCRLQLASPTAL